MRTARTTRQGREATADAEQDPPLCHPPQMPIVQDAGPSERACPVGGDFDAATETEPRTPAAP